MSPVRKAHLKLRVGEAHDSAAYESKRAEVKTRRSKVEGSR